MRLRLLPALLVASGLSFYGCATTSSDSASSTAATPDSAAGGGAPADDEASASVRDFHRHHHRAGVAAFIDLGIDTLGIEDAAKKAQIEQVQATLKEKMAPVHEAEKALLQAIADGVAAGTIDTAKVDAAQAAVATAAGGVHDATTDALNQLHGILSPAERQALADKVQAHWEVWRKVNHDAEVGGKEKGGRLHHLQGELALTDDQVEKISAALKDSAAKDTHTFDPAEAEAHMQAFTTAFASDTFDAKTLTQAGMTSSKMVTHSSHRMVHFYETVTPLLTPDQRTKLAEHLHNRSQPKADAPA